MITSLRTRLILTIASVSVPMLIFVGLLSGRVSTMELEREIAREESSLQRKTAEALQDLFLRQRSWQGVDQALESFASVRSRGVVLLAPDSEVPLASVVPNRRILRVQIDSPDRVTLHFIDETRKEPVRGQLVIDGMKPTPIEIGGDPIGFVLLLPPDPPSDSLRERVVTRARPGLIGLLAGATVVSLLLAFATSKHILDPIAELTLRTRRIARGETVPSSPIPTSWKDEIGELTRAYDGMARALRQAEELRQRTINDVAHELRTPLTHLKGQLEAIEDGLLEVNAETLGSMTEEVELLERMTRDLQDLALLEAGEIGLERKRLSLEDLIHAASRAFETRILEQEISLKVCVPENLPPTHGDRDRLAQVLYNLLSNAVRATPRGGIIRLAARVESEAVVLECSDSGPGIPSEHRALIFERFYRIHPARDRGSGGSGLGLAIVKQLVEAHGGTVELRCPEAGGALFSIRLPL